MQIGEFNMDGAVEFYTVKPKEFDTRRLQSAMFSDRPDLWKKPKKARARHTPPEQQKLL